MADDASPLTQDPAAAPVLELMRLERWRKARDAAKDLCKKDRSRYLQLLIDANVGLVREMLGKGLQKEAATVVDYLATIAPAEQVAALRLELTSPVGKRQVQALGDSGAAGWWAAALRADEGLAAGRHFGADLAAVDLLVTDPFQPSPSEADERGRRLAGELAAVRVACDATGDGRWNEAREALRKLPRQSVFWQWRLFLRGVRCVFENDPETARQCFDQLLPAGALARAATVFGPELSNESKAAPVSAKVPFFLAATGQPAAWSAPILAAAASWKSGHRVKAFTELAIAMKDVFPSREPGLPAVLSDALLPYKSRMRSGDMDDSERLVKRYYSQPPKNVKGEVVLAVMRGMCLAESEELLLAALDRFWRHVIELLNTLDGPNPLRNSLAWQWLGERMLDSNEEASPFWESDSRRPDYDRAQKALEMAVSVDPGNEAAALSLVNVLILKRDAKASNRLLDDLVKRFPRNKEVILLAGNQALERKSYARALDSLRAALALDPLDKEVKSRIATALLAQIRDATHKKKPAAAFWDELEPLLESRLGGGPPLLSRWMARVRRSLLETEPEAAEQARLEAEKLAPSTIECLFFEATEAGSLRLPLRGGWSREWTKARKSGLSGWADVYRLLEILNATKAVNSAFRETTMRLLKDAANTLTGTNLEKDPDGLLVFLGQSGRILREMEDLAKDGAGTCLSILRRSLKKAAPPGQRKADPRLRLAAFILTEKSRRFAYISPDKAVRDLDEMIVDLESGGFHAARTLAEKLRQEFLAECDDDEEFDDIDDFGPDDPIDFMDAPDLGDGLLERMLEDLTKVLGKAGEAEARELIEQMRTSFKELRLPEDALDQAIDKAAASRKPNKPKQPKSPPSNPNQLDLF